MNEFRSLYFWPILFIVKNNKLKLLLNVIYFFYNISYCPIAVSFCYESRPLYNYCIIATAFYSFAREGCLSIYAAAIYDTLKTGTTKQQRRV